MFKKSILAVSALLVLPVFSMAQSNDGATVVATFMVTPPTVDGTISAGEWDAAGVAPGEWSDHGSATPADAAFPTSVRVAYSVDGLYILFECVDDLALAAAGGSESFGGEQPFTFGGETDYLAVYLDPSNYADANPGSNRFSYSIQCEPGMTANNADASYTYTELGQFGNMANKIDPPITNADGNLQYWSGGLGWDAPGLVVMDGATADGFAMELFIPWNALPGYTLDWTSEPLDGIADIRLDNTDPFGAANASVPGFRFAEDGTAYAVGIGAVTGMPLPGTVWKAQFCRYTDTAAPAYSNWVGDTGGFVSRPFGNIEFGGLGDNPGSAVAEALSLHSN